MPVFSGNFGVDTAVWLEVEVCVVDDVTGVLLVLDVVVDVVVFGLVPWSAQPAASMAIGMARASR